MSSRKVRAGVSFDPELVAMLDFHAKELTELQVDRSEIVNAILDLYFEGNGSAESVWGVVTKRRIAKRH